MADPRLFRLRVSFVKQGRLTLLSHLELARTLERIVRRAGVPFAVTNGFSPHMRIAFGSALPVGVGGREELFDLFLTNYIAPAKILPLLQGASPLDLMPFACEYVEPQAPAVSVAFPLSTYEAVLEGGLTSLVIPEVVQVKRGKKEKVLMVAEYLRGDVEARSAEDVEETSGTATPQTILRFCLEAKPSGTLRPDKFVEAIMASTISAGGASSELRSMALTRLSQRAL